jgi:hypothetical protein
MHNETLTPAAAARRTPASRALVPVVACARTHNERDGRTSHERASFTGMLRQAGASAGFVTQLIACADNLPAYRARRRAEPQEAARRYAGAPAAPASRRGIAV